MIPQIDRTEIPRHPILHRGRVLATKVENRVDQILKGHALGRKHARNTAWTFPAILPPTVAPLSQYPGRQRPT